MEMQEVHQNIIQDTLDIQPKFSWRTVLEGRPLATADAKHQAIGKLIGLAVFSSDALSSVAYGPQEAMVILAAAGSAALGLTFPIVLGIVALLLILTFSYEQTIHAYPGGGGAYIVARDNLGELPAQAAGAALLMDYILTVAVSMSSGVLQITSAYPILYPYRVFIAVGLIMLVMTINLRGVKESGITFAIPTYLFLGLTGTLLIVGFIQLFTGSLGTVINPPHLEVSLVQPISLLLILRAFANGTSSVTGVEAISNGITAFKEPSSKNAGITLLWMAAILGTMLLGITYLAVKIGAVPAESETVISQIIRTIYGGQGFIYFLTISSTTIILVMAANTAFADFPRLGALQAGDGFLPRQLTSKGSRLVFDRGIITLAALASGLVIIFQGSVTRLIPLYAIGVFLSFTLSQFGMARRWWKSGHLKAGEEIIEAGSTVRFDKGWIHKMVINSIGGFCTFVVMVVFGATKFLDGAWVVIFALPILIAIFFAIHRHYQKLAYKLSLQNIHHPKRIIRNRVIMPIAGVHNGTLKALKFAESLSDDVTAIHIGIDPHESARLEEKWKNWGDNVRLIVLSSPYRLFLEPFLEYVDHLCQVVQPNEVITIVVPQFVPTQRASRFLHTRTAESLRKALLDREGIVIIEVPYQV